MNKKHKRTEYIDLYDVEVSSNRKIKESGWEYETFVIQENEIRAWPRLNDFKERR